MLDLVHLRDRIQKRETRLLSFLFFLKNKFWAAVFGKEADQLERDRNDERTCKLVSRERIYQNLPDYMIEKEPLVNRYTRYTFEPPESERKSRTSISVYM